MAANDQLTCTEGVLLRAIEECSLNEALCSYCNCRYEDVRVNCFKPGSRAGVVCDLVFKINIDIYFRYDKSNKDLKTDIRIYPNEYGTNPLTYIYHVDTSHDAMKGRDHIDKETMKLRDLLCLLVEKVKLPNCDNLKGGLIRYNENGVEVILENISFSSVYEREQKWENRDKPRKSAKYRNSNYSRYID